MNLILISAISELLIFILCQLIFLQRKKQNFQASLYFMLIGASFLVTGYLFMMSSIGFELPFTLEAKVLQIVWIAFFLILLLARISNIRKLEFLIPLLFVPLLVVFYNTPWQTITMSIAHYIIGIVFFILFILSTRKIKHSGLFGLAYVFSIILILLTSGLSGLNEIIFIPNILLLIAFVYFIRYGLEFDHFVRPQKLKIKLMRSPLLSFLRLIVYITLLNASILSASLVLHEAGHLTTGAIYGCQGGTIIILDLFPETPDPYTELTCPEPIQEVILALSGFMFVIPFGIIFLFLRRFPEKNFAYVVFGMAISLGAQDMLLAFPFLYIPYIFMFVGTFIAALGELLLIYDYTSHHDHHHTHCDEMHD
ncbi:MAG: hypothetical protein ABIH52_03060 [Candidatus Aenigmatarchaeota archaeon]|nr:hypothetical protein [Nanoarchaeota archaeon]